MYVLAIFEVAFVVHSCNSLNNSGKFIKVKKSDFVFVYGILEHIQLGTVLLCCFTVVFISQSQITQFERFPDCSHNPLNNTS